MFGCQTTEQHPAIVAQSRIVLKSTLCVEGHTAVCDADCTFATVCQSSFICMPLNPNGCTSGSSTSEISVCSMVIDFIFKHFANSCLSALDIHR